MNPFNSKVLLFGEYTILSGSNALAIPFSRYSGRLVLPCNNELPNQTTVTSNQSIKRWVKFITDQKSFNNPPNEQKLLSDALLGLYFDSNIPEGYGVGSSGSLTAAVYHRYFYDSTEYERNPTMSLQELKADLSLMESFFHGTSSGIDPLVSYLNEPVLIKEGQIFEHPFNLPNDLIIFLIDTGKPAKTENLVELYRKKLEVITLKPQLTKMAALTDQIIEAFVTNTASFKMVEELSYLQQSVLKEMFVLNEPLKNALQQFSGSLSIKLCGSGGGGFLLGFAKFNDFDEINQYLKLHQISIIPIEN